MTRLVRVQNFFLSRDGFGSGEGQSLERPFGHANPADLASWAGATASWPNRTEPGGTRGLDDYFTRDFSNNIGAEIMGRNKFAPKPGPWPDDEWTGWWGDNPPFHTPVVVLTHHPRPPLELDGGTTFHFLDATPVEALDRARELAGDLDIRIGGGTTTVRDFLRADLVDEMHIAVVPIFLGRGERLWDGLEGLEDRFDIDTVTSPSGVVHVSFSRPSVAQ